MKYQKANKSFCFLKAILLLCLLTSCATEPAEKSPSPQAESAPAPEVQKAEAEPVVIEPKAINALTQMGNYLQTLKTFKVGLKLYKDEVLLSGQKVMINGSSDLTVQRPDRFHFTNKVDEAFIDQHYYYDGKSFTIYGNTLKYYATMPAPPTISELLTVAAEKHGINMPFADLFLWGTEKSDTNAIKSAIYIGPTKVNNVPCDHYAYRNDDVDWQLWIEQGKKPLPRKLVITTTEETSQPQSITIIDWNLAPKISKGMFTFVPPKDAHKIEFAKFEQDAETAQ